MRRITKLRASFSSNGDLIFPGDIKFPGHIKPKINTNEWLFMMFESADKKYMTKEREEELRSILFKNKRNQNRIKNGLKRKGFKWENNKATKIK